MTSPESAAASEPVSNPEPAESIPSTADWPVRDYVADGSTAQQIVNGYLRDLNTNPIVIAFYAVLVIVGAWLIATLTSSWIIAAVAVGAAVPLTIGLDRLRGSRGRAGVYARKFQNVYGPGLRTQIQLRENSLWIKTAVSEGTNDYSVFKTAVRSGGAVLIKTGPLGVTMVLPGQLFDEAEFKELQRRIAAATSRR